MRSTSTQRIAVWLTVQTFLLQSSILSSPPCRSADGGYRFEWICALVLENLFWVFNFCFCEQVLITENQKSFSHFITNVCAIIGGVFTVCICYYLRYSGSVLVLFFIEYFSPFFFFGIECIVNCIVDKSFLWFQVAGIMDSIMHNTIRLMKKIELGKNFW